MNRKAYHGIEIGEPVNQSGSLGELLLKSIAEIVSRVGGDDQNGGSDSGEKDREDRATCRFAHATFAANKDPLEALLFQYVLYSPLW